MKFDRPMKTVGGKDLQFPDQHRRPWFSKVQLVSMVCLKPATESLVLCRLTAQGIGPLGIVEGEMGGLTIAGSFPLPDYQGRLWVLRLHGGPDRRELMFETLRGAYSCVEMEDFFAGWADAADRDTTSQRGIPS